MLNALADAAPARAGITQAVDFLQEHTRRNRLSHEPEKRMVTTGRFEIERNGAVAYLEFSLSPGVLELIHTEVPAAVRRMGLASSLAETALQYARQNHLKVDIICPIALKYVEEHPEYSDLVMH